ncbi:PLU-1-like protein-domain-containing protein, partial [Fomitopsis serialis]|uniref:PLU-1-like protein-domain-containing protein n=1 Tax=Fomitopsis serialis TaxID=139415 RepID=UPI00200872A4
DHYTYSINYSKKLIFISEVDVLTFAGYLVHWGETKTWYSIPGEEAEKFEAAIRREAPDLFEVQPDLLFQLVTLMNPSRLKETGVDVYSCNQRAGEFVITFPKAYHAGFNHGVANYNRLQFNFNEAVNFALPDWLPFGLDCVKRYQEHRKLPVFSHDELLITITQQNQSIQTALWLNDSLQEMMVREMRIRDKARSLQMGEVLEGMDRAEDQCQCSRCKVFCYLSQITCSCTTKVVCIDHIEICARDQMKVSERAAIPSTWRTKLNKILTETARPPLRSLRAVLAEGDRINHPLPELQSLRKCVARANEWVDAANAFLVRKPSRKRPRKIRGPRTSSDSANGMNMVDDAPDRPDHSLGDLYAVLKEVENLGFDCQEIGFLRNLAKEAEETKEKARILLNATPSPRDRDAHMQECDRLLLHGLSLNVLVEELLEVEKIVLREQLLKDLEEELDESNGVLLEDVRSWVARARQCDLPPDNPFMKRIERLLRLGDEWERRVKDVLTKPQRTIEQLDEFAHPGSGCCQAGGQGGQGFNIPAVSDLKRTVDFAMDLETRCDAVLKHRYQHTDEGDIFQTMLQWRKYAKEHLTMFTLANFDRLDKQLSAHFRWLESLPWFCRQHQETHAQGLMEDVIESTRPEDDLPPNDEYFTCICVIGQFLSFASQPANQRAEYIPQVRHYMRKLYRIQFAVSPNPEVSFGLDLAGLHRILAGQPVPVRMKKRRRPKFVFGQDVDPDWRDGTRCICRGRTSYLLNYPTVQCEVCEKLYHAGCVFYPVDNAGGVRRFMCPLCCIRKNRAYPYSEVRVKYAENPEADVYVNTKEMLQNFSKEIIYMKLPPPYTQTLFVELIRSAPIPPPNPYENGKPIGIADPSSSRHVPPPPPWSNQIWSNAGATAPPPGARPHPDPRSPHATSPHVANTPPQSSAVRKRKYPDEVPPHTPDERLGRSFSPGPPKRRQPSDTPQPASTSTPRSNQGLSPSLAMMLSPGPNDILLSMLYTSPSLTVHVVIRTSPCTQHSSGDPLSFRVRRTNGGRV